MKLTLKCTLYLIFIISLFTGINALIGGALNIPGATTVSSAAVDSELRCLAIFWIAYGIFCFWTARNIDDRARFIPFLAIVMLLSGLARLLSIILVGLPGTALFFAMIIEFILSILLYSSYKTWKKKR